MPLAVVESPKAIADNPDAVKLVPMEIACCPDDTAPPPNAIENSPEAVVAAPIAIAYWSLAFTILPMHIEKSSAKTPLLPIAMDDDVIAPAFALSPYQIPSVPGEVGYFVGVANASKTTGDVAFGKHTLLNTDEHVMSSGVMTSNVGTAGEPVAGPRKNVFASCVEKVPVSVPVPVTGTPGALKTEPGKDNPTLVTVPMPVMFGKHSACKGAAHVVLVPRTVESATIRLPSVKFGPMHEATSMGAVHVCPLISMHSGANGDEHVIPIESGTIVGLSNAVNAIAIAATEIMTAFAPSRRLMATIIARAKGANNVRTKH
jgi:hypothetical protein